MVRGTAGADAPDPLPPDETLTLQKTRVLQIEDDPAASCRESSPVRKWSFYIRSLILQQATGNALADAVQGVQG